MEQNKKTISNYIKIYIVPYLLHLFVRFIYFTSKKNFHFNQRLNNEAFILSFWHGDLLMQAFNYKAFKPNGKVKVIVSSHRDGQVIKKVVNYFGVGALEGSSTRGGAKALIGAIRSIREGIDVAITPDGPKGPIYNIADGIILLAKKTGAKIICFYSEPVKYWEFKSWDKFKIPKPFTTIDFYTSMPLDISSLEINEAKKLLKKNMSKAHSSE